MKPILTPAEMTEVDRSAPEAISVLIERAGAAVACAALEMLGGAYGRRVVVVAGKGNNGADGHAAAARLRRRGVSVQVVDAARLPPTLPAADLVIDAGYGTGFRREFLGCELTGRTKNRLPQVLAVDITSGVSGIDGSVSGTPWTADRTITFAAYKPGLLFSPGSEFCGEITVADIGLDVGPRPHQLIEPSDLGALSETLTRPVQAHKWMSACWVVGGCRTMPGAASLAAAAAMSAGAGYARISSPGLEPGAASSPIEAVHFALADHGWATEMAAPAAQIDRFGCLVIGPGLGRGSHTDAEIVQAVAHLDVPMVIDADALRAVAAAGPGVLATRRAPTILTPHDGERAAFDHWFDGSESQRRPRTGCERIDATTAFAAIGGVTVLLKGPTTTVAGPDGRVRLVRSGDSRLATAGTGDVLAGIIGALVAQGLEPLEAAALGAEVHGAAAKRCHRTMVAGDLIAKLPEVLEQPGPR